jgi:TolB-like protein/tetratricopeptide (TPR) repeat protein
MADESSKPANTPLGAVFLSYASEDVSAAERIAYALRAAGVEVWIDRSELRGGDAWDQSIRKQIKACALFIPIISRHAHDRIEGYFRLEWKLAVDRSHLIAPDQAFLLPVAIDDTPQSDERIPDRFRELQWTCLPAGETTPGFIERVRRLLSHEASSPRATVAPVSLTVHASGEPVTPSWRSKAGVWVIGAVLTVALAYIAVDKLLVSRHLAPLTPPAASPTQTPVPASATAAFNPPPHSVAVLPFVNMSGDKDQEYFSDGLTEEILNSLARINELQVSARTSSFSFKGKDVDVGTIAHKLNVGSVLEGSVRRSGHTIRVTAQLNNAVTGFHLWSETYDRDLGDVLRLQTDIANAVAGALKLTILRDLPAKIELGGTHNPEALDAYLIARRDYFHVKSARDELKVIAAYTAAIRLDPKYALALIGRSEAFCYYATHMATGRAVHESLEKAAADARQGLALAPGLAEGHLALGWYFVAVLDFRRGNDEYQRAAALAPHSARVLRFSGFLAAAIGHIDAGIAAIREETLIDPLSPRSHANFGDALTLGRRFDEALAAYGRAISLDPDDPAYRGPRSVVFYLLGNLQAARTACENHGDDPDFLACLAMTYYKLGRRTDAEAALAKLTAAHGDDDAYAYAQIYAQWGEVATALAWLEKALRLRDSGLVTLRTEPLLDPLRSEPRFQAIERELKFPD